MALVSGGGLEGGLWDELEILRFPGLGSGLRLELRTSSVAWRRSSMAWLILSLSLLKGRESLILSLLNGCRNTERCPGSTCWSWTAVPTPLPASRWRLLACPPDYLR